MDTDTVDEIWWSGRWWTLRADEKRMYEMNTEIQGDDRMKEFVNMKTW